VPTVAFGADAHVAEAFAVGFLPPIIPSLGCGPFWAVLVWIRAPSQADSWHGPYYTVVRPGVRCCLGGELGRCCVGSGFV